MKRIISTILILVTIFAAACPAYAAEPRYANASGVYVTLNINSSGKATVAVRVTGNSSLSSSEILTYIEKKVGSTWTRVDIGTTNDVWEYTSTNSAVLKTYTAQLSSTGEYRAVAEFTLTGSTAEEITKTATATY